MNSNKKGFTLIELMVVIAIIGILISIVLESTSAARANARDDRRISDMREIQIDLAQYFAAERSYPVETSNDDAANYASMLTALGSVLIDVGDLPAKDPSGVSYGYTSTGPNYCLGANLEVTTNIPSDNFSCLPTLPANPSYNYSVLPPQ